MLNSDLLQQAIEDAKAVRHLGLAWREGQFGGSMKYVSGTSNQVERATCYCTYCHQSMPLEKSSSHALTCTQERSSSYNAWISGEDWRNYSKIPSFCEGIEKRIKEGKFGKVDKYRV